MDFLERMLGQRAVRILVGLAGLVRALIFAGSVAAGAITLLVLGAKYFAIAPAAAAALFALLVLLLAVSGYAYHYVAHVYDPPFYEITELTGSLRVEPVDTHYRYRYERRQTIRATRSDLRLIEIRGHWTGKGSSKPDVTSLKPQHALLDGRRPERDNRVHRWIYPRHGIKRGDSEEVGVIQVHEDDIERQDAYFREGGGRYRTRKVTVVVELPVSEVVSGSVKGVIWNTVARPPDNEEVGILEFTTTPNHSPDGYMKYTVTASNPRPYYSYGIEWTWQNEPLD